jgi:glutamate formiminotransferase/formiminotetrahydrofolate cyclodeaminase
VPGGGGALALRSCIKGAFLNVKFNASGLQDKDFINSILERGEALEAKTVISEDEILKIINEKIKIL